MPSFDCAQDGEPVEPLNLCCFVPFVIIEVLSAGDLMDRASKFTVRCEFRLRRRFCSHLQAEQSTSERQACEQVRRIRVNSRRYEERAS